MSRKREQQRETRKELARQLGVKGNDVPEQIIDNERVTEPELSAHLDIEVAKRGLFKAPGIVDVHVALFVVDNRGARLARTLSLQGASGRAPCAAVLTTTSKKQTDVVRYRRPGHFVVVALATESAAPDRNAAHAAALTNERLQIVVDGVAHARDDRALAKQAPSRATLQLGQLGGVPVVDAAQVLFSGAAVVGIQVVHRVNETVVLPLVSDDGRFAAKLSVSLRL